MFGSKKNVIIIGVILLITVLITAISVIFAVKNTEEPQNNDSITNKLISFEAISDEEKQTALRDFEERLNISYEDFKLKAAPGYTYKSSHLVVSAQDNMEYKIHDYIFTYDSINIALCTFEKPLRDKHTEEYEILTIADTEAKYTGQKTATA